MSESSGPPLAGLWGKRYEEVWRPRFDAVFEAISRIPVQVLLWGPGTGSTHYAKREQIGASLAGDATNVATSEALMEADPRFGLLGDTLLAEGIQAESADLVIALAVDDREATGVHVELTKFGDHPRIGPKIHLLVPLRPSRTHRALLLEASGKVPQDRRFEYTADQYVSCLEMRAKARAWIEAVRKEKSLSLLRRGGQAE